MGDEILIKGARVIDGTGAPWTLADVVVRDAIIAGVGPGLSAPGASVIDAGGRYLAPGFIDAHCHDDLITLREPERIEKVAQGVTTIVVGNCSFSLYPAPKDRADLLGEHFGSLLGETAKTEIFEDFGAYRAALLSRGLGLNLVSLVGHGALRLAVLGYDRRAASPAERASMQDLLARQLSQGAIGLSLGLVYPPSAYADEAELMALAETVRDHGKLLTAHIRSYEGGLLASVDEFLAILTRSGAAGLLSHLQAAGRPNWGGVPPVLARLEAARSEGIDVSFDMYPYPAGSTYVLQLLPPSALEGGHEALLGRLRDATQREALRHWVEEGSGDPHFQSKVSLIGWENVRLSAIETPQLKRLEGQSIAEAARAEGVAPFDLMARLVEEDRGHTGIILFQLDEADLHAACTHRLHLVCSDGLPRPGTRPHPRGYGTFPRIAGRLVREGWFALEDGVRRMTSAPAQRFGLTDRGVIREGLAADLVLFEAAIEDRATFEKPTELPSGISHVIVAGMPVLAEGRPTGRLPGRVLPIGEARA
jgi:N-acyl-D-amino-acid deacylase